MVTERSRVGAEIKAYNLPTTDPLGVLSCTIVLTALSHSPSSPCTLDLKLSYAYTVHHEHSRHHRHRLCHLSMAPSYDFFEKGSLYAADVNVIGARAVGSSSMNAARCATQWRATVMACSSTVRKTP